MPTATRALARRRRGAPLRTLVAVLALLLLVAACAAEGDGETAGGATERDREDGDAAPADEGDAAATPGGEPEGEPIVIGVNVEQSGPASVQGEAYTRAVELLAERINADGGVLGRPLELRIVDNGTDPTRSVTQTQALVEEGVVAIVGPGTSPTTLAAMDAITSAGIPAISMGSADAIVEPVEERPNVFKTPQRGSMMAQTMADHMQEEGISRVGLIAVNNPYGDDGISAWEEIQEAGDIEVARTERFEPSDTDMTAQLRNVLDADVEAIVTWAIPPGAPTVRRNAVEDVGVDVPMYFDAGAGAELFIELAGDAADGALIAHPRTLIWDQVAEDDPQHEALTTFGEAYSEAHGEVSGFAGYAWDALALLRDAIETAGSTEPAAIIDALESTEHVGVTGVFTITPDDHQGLDQGALEILVIEDGDWRSGQ